MSLCLSQYSRHVVAVMLLVSLLQSAAVLGAPIVNPTLSAVIDPSGGDTVDVNAVNAVTGITGLEVIPHWDGWVQADAKGAGQFVVFTDPTRPDFRFKDGGGGGATHLTTQGNQGTSTNSTADSVRFRSHSNRPIGVETSMVIELVDYDTDTSTYSALPEGVQSIAFTMSDVSAVQNLRVEFYDGTTLLSTQTATGGAGSSSGDALDVYFGYTADSSASIDRVVVTRILTALTDGTSDQAPSVYFDDLGFTLVPEPGSLCLGVVALMLVAGRTCAPPRPLK